MRLSSVSSANLAMTGAAAPALMIRKSVPVFRSRTFFQGSSVSAVSAAKAAHEEQHSAHHDCRESSTLSTASHCPPPNAAFRRQYLDS